MNELSQCHLSIILPVFNEQDNIRIVLKEIRETVQGYPTMEIIAVDDGSTDDTATILREIYQDDNRLTVIFLARNYGQTTALAAGMDAASGEVIITMDADGQNDPADISILLREIEKGFDIVSGWRRNRKDAWLRSWLSRRANALIRRASGQVIHDYGCTLKVYKRSAIEHLSLYGDMHRFLVAYAAVHGACVTEVETHHRPRMHGRSKYGFGRIWKVFLDLVFLNFFLNSLTRPMHFFGGIGLSSIFLGFITIIAAIAVRFLGGPTLIETPLPVLSVLFVIIGVQCLLMGVLGELSMRTYFQSQSGRSYMIRETLSSSK